MSKYLDSNGLLYLWGKIKGLTTSLETLISGKVDKVEGKSLSTNDFTNTEKAKLEGLENYTLPTASAETLGGVKVGVGLAVNNGVLSATGGGTADSVDWDNVQNKPDIALKSDITNVYKYKGSVEAFANLPTENNTPGDVYNVESSGMNYAWTGTTWDALGEILDIEAITNAEIDAIVGG